MGPINGGEVLVYQAEDGSALVEVRLERDTVWLTQAQMAELFGRERSVITKHVRNVFREGELAEESNVQNLHIAGSDKPVGFYNLNVIISVGYRVKSLRGTQFRIWATRVLRDHLVKGYSVNAARLRDLRQAVRLIADTARRRDLAGDEAQALLAIVGEYNRALELLDDYDHQRVAKPGPGGAARYVLGHDEALRIVGRLRERFAASDIFGVEKDKGLESALGAIMQTFGGRELYPGLEEKAAHLLYFLVKNHAFVDGNKRIAAALFLWYLERNGALLRDDGTPRMTNGTLVALTLMIAESRPEEKDMLVRIVMHLLAGGD
ncbi:MAG: cytochrome C biogenesis protein CycH [Rhodocyclales bacterium]|nr:MAG: cytochrome C biogenesis protein CycH [Rhodocyclales bacterium]